MAIRKSHVSWFYIYKIIQRSHFLDFKFKTEHCDVGLISVKHHVLIDNMGKASHL